MRLLIIITLWTLWLPALLAGTAGLGALSGFVQRHRARRTPARPTLAEQLQADQRRHVARWAHFDGDDRG